MRKRGKKASASVADNAVPSPASVRNGTGSFTPGEEKDAVPPAPEVSKEEAWREQYKDLI